MKKLFQKEYIIWIVAGFFLAFFMYVSSYGFTLNTRWEFILLYLVGGLFWGVLTGFFFNLSYHGRNYDTEKYKKVMRKRLHTGRKLNRNLREYNLFIHIRDLEAVKDLWDIMIVKVRELELVGIIFVNQENWYDEIYISLIKVIKEKSLTVKEYNELSDIVSQFNEYDKDQLKRLGIIQFDMLLTRMMDIIGNYILVTKDEIDEFEVLFIYYYYSLKLGIVELNEFNEFLNSETLKDNVKDVIIDLQFVSNRGVNEIIDVMHKYIEDDKMVIKKYILILVAKGLSYQAIKLYKEHKKTENEFLNIMYTIYGFFKFIPELHVFDNYEYYPEFDGMEMGIKRQEEYSINIMEFLGKE